MNSIKMLFTLFIIIFSPSIAQSEGKPTFISFSSLEKSNNFNFSSGGEFRLFGENETFTPIFRVLTNVDYTLKAPYKIQNDYTIATGVRFKNTYGVHSFLGGYALHRDFYVSQKIYTAKTGVNLTYDGWFNLPKDSSIAVYSNYLAPLNRFEIQIAPGKRFNIHEKFKPIFGFEARYTKQNDNQAYRIGIHMTDFGFTNFRFRLSSGINIPAGNKSNYYVGLSFWRHLINRNTVNDTLPY